MFRNIVWAVLLVSFAVVAQAQSATGANRLTFDLAAPTLAEATGYAYKYYPDGATVGIPLASVTCATGPALLYVCSAPFPAFTPGAHSLTLTASNLAGESSKSVILSFTFVILPNSPANPRIQ